MTIKLSGTLVTILVFLFGTCIGSFLNVCIHRIPRKESIVFMGSACPSCRKNIAFHDNIPLLSYLVLGGRCRNCGNPISTRYPVVEALTGLVFVVLYLKFGLTGSFLVYSIFSSALIVVAFIDFSLKIIPDVITLPGIVAGVVARSLVADTMWTGLVDSLLGVVAGGGVLVAVAWLYLLATGREGMGGGDVKLLAMIGAFTGWKGVVVTLIGGAFVGSVVGMVLIAAYGRDSKYAVPFGPFLAGGALFHLLYGREFMEWYLTLIGAV